MNDHASQMSAQAIPAVEPTDRLDDLRRCLQYGDLELDAAGRRLMGEVELEMTMGFIALLRANGELLDVNPGALRAGGLERAEVVGARLWNTPWFRESPRAQEDTVRALGRVIAEGGNARLDVDVWIESGGDARGTLDLILRPLRGADGTVDLVLADGRSVTDRKQVERRITRQHAEVRVLNDRLALIVDHHQRLLGNLSHDLRMPIQVVQTRIERILDLVDDPVIRAEAHAVRASASGALAQMESMLEQARRGDAEDRLDLTDGDLAGTLRAVVAEFAPLAERRRVRMDVVTPEHLPAAFDAEKVSRTVANLLTNALRFTPTDGVVRCLLTVHGSLAHLEVADSGPGMSPAVRERAFERYATGGDARSGRGLGLAIVHDFVLLHGGTVSIDTAPEGGALLIMTLPLDAPGPTGAATLAQHVAVVRQAEAASAELEAMMEGAEAYPVPPRELLAGGSEPWQPRVCEALGQDTARRRVGEGLREAAPTPP